MHAEIKKQTLALSDILAEFEINRLGKLMFRTVAQCAQIAILRKKV